MSTIQMEQGNIITVREWGNIWEEKLGRVILFSFQTSYYSFFVCFLSYNFAMGILQNM